MEAIEKYINELKEVNQEFELILNSFLMQVHKLKNKVELFQLLII